MEWPWPILRQIKFGNLGFSIGKSENSGFLETIEACDLKVGRYRQLIDFLKVCEYINFVELESPMLHFLTLAQGREHTKI